VIVAEEQARQEGVDSEVSEATGFSSAKTVMAQLKSEKETKPQPRLHPMFRNRGPGASSSRSGSAQPNHKKKPRMKIHDDDVVELLSSEDEIEAFDASVGEARRIPSPATDGVE